MNLKKDLFYTEGEGLRLAAKQWRFFWSWLSLPLLFQHMWLTYNWWSETHYWENRKILLNRLKRGEFKIVYVKTKSNFFYKSIDIMFDGSEEIYNIWLWYNGNLTMSSNSNSDLIGLFHIGPIEYYRVNRCWKILDECTSDN